MLERMRGYRDRPTVRQHNRTVRDTGKAGKEPESDVCKHPRDLRFRGICVDCEAVVPMPTRPRTATDEVVARYNAIISKRTRNPRKPHQFELNCDAVEGSPMATRCWCGKPETARIHTDGPADLAAHFKF
jgi:hypothetical protein